MYIYADDFPFISYLVDSYQRDRMLSKGQELTAASWAKESPCMIFYILYTCYLYICILYVDIKKVMGKSKKKANTLQSGIETYMKRVAPRFHWK